MQGSPVITQKSTEAEGLAGGGWVHGEGRGATAATPLPGPCPVHPTLALPGRFRGRVCPEPCRPGARGVAAGQPQSSRGQDPGPSLSGESERTVGTEL